MPNNYKQLLNEHEIFNGFDYLSSQQAAELRRDLKNAGGVTLAEFNNRATIYTDGGAAVLRSYDTEVCKIIDGHFIKLWKGFSVTTLKHINAFRRVYNMPALSKKDWIMLPC